MRYSKHSMVNKKPIKNFVTDWHHKEGVFETPQGKFIARVKKILKNNSIGYETISQHNTKEEAQIAYDKHPSLPVDKEK